MNVHKHARVWLAEFVGAHDRKWQVTTATVVDLNATLTAQVGHAAPTPDSFARRRIALPLTLWANEGNANQAIEDLYAAVSWEPGSLTHALTQHERVKVVTVDAVGPQREGPTGFVAAELTVTVLFPREA